MSLGSQHAHAWVEVPLEGLGWVVFDPTPPSLAGTNDEPAVEAVEAPADEFVGTILERWIRSSAAWIVLAITALGALLALSQHGVQRGAKHVQRRHVDPDLSSMFRTLVSALRKRVPQSPGQTIWEYAAVLQTRPELPIGGIRSAFTAYEEVRFGNRTFDRERRERIAAAIREVRRSS
jgi:hypothetical protein